MTNTNKSFFLISHSQKDKEVIEDTKYFDSVFANYWLDIDGMRLTDETWIDTVKKTLENDNCKGVVFYFSENSLSSSAVEEEIRLVIDKRKTNKDFFVIAVFINGRDVPHLIKKVYSALDDSELSDVLPLSRIGTISELLCTHKLIIHRDINHLDHYYETMINNLSEKQLVLNRELLESKLQNNNKLDSNRRFSFGRFYTADIIPSMNLPTQNVYKKVNGKWYIKLFDNSVHKVDPIKWIILDYRDGIVTLLSERVLDRIVGQEIDSWLNTTFRSLAFNERQRGMLVSPIRTLTYEEYENYNKQKSINPREGRFWLNSINKRGQSNMLMCVNGSTINILGLHKKNKCGIRPVIEIKEDDLFSACSEE